LLLDLILTHPRLCPKANKYKSPKGIYYVNNCVNYKLWEQAL